MDGSYTYSAQVLLIPHYGQNHKKDPKTKKHFCFLHQKILTAKNLPSNTYFCQFHPQKYFHWHILFLEWKRPHSFRTKFWNCGHSVLWKHVKLPSRLAQTTKGWHDKNWTLNSALHCVLEWVRLWFFFSFLCISFHNGRSLY